MARAAALGRAVRRGVSPNPGVGAVVETRDGRMFEGATEPPGRRHAEIVALDAAGDAARDATVWVTLEPCAHTGRTGPCADALIDAGVQRIVIGLEDPDPNVAGRGIAHLRAAGATVEVLDDRNIAQDLRAYLTHRRLGRPFVTLKLAMTTDGRTTPDVDQWITGPAARADGHRLRAENDAILVGANTVRVDNPRLTTRDAPGPDPVRVVLGHAPPDAAIHPCIEVSGDLEAVLRDLGGRGITSLLVEGGETTGRALHDVGLVDEYVFYVADARLDSVTRLWGLEVVDAAQIGNDVRVTLVPRGER
ncbi:MAG TPA: bifunctional diaminohydroxyphosphoribosylaminopyrimidine deaminase/5-amino-6-(5-phosphoribosylamino)uracil reductase RibD [Acidimicrobiales bacterium]|nr:bifunctional diaminohydroxyphosphoribosylaminopyrimidine deaminase/5-amino-6-(5-phosphoribosylamino)uracil reductase RibD [Acidimicrobiales bacterium]